MQPMSRRSTSPVTPTSTPDSIRSARRPARRDPRRPRLRARTSPTTCSPPSGPPRQGWHDARVTAYGPLSLDPATAVLHYAQEIFEGLKAYRHADGSVWTFRPEANAARMQRSATRLALPELPVDDFLASIDALVRVDERWVPERRRGRRASTCGRSCSPPRRSSGCGPAQHVTYMVIASPAGAYFASGPKPVSILVSEHYTRAGRRRHGRGQDRRQLRQLAGAAAGGHRPRLRPGRVPRRHRAAGTSRSSAG